MVFHSSRTTSLSETKQNKFEQRNFRRKSSFFSSFLRSSTLHCSNVERFRSTIRFRNHFSDKVRNFSFIVEIFFIENFSSHFLQAESQLECDQWISVLQTTIANLFKSNDAIKINGFTPVRSSRVFLSTWRVFFDFRKFFPTINLRKARLAPSSTREGECKFDSFFNMESVIRERVWQRCVRNKRIFNGGKSWHREILWRVRLVN